MEHGVVGFDREEVVASLFDVDLPGGLRAGVQGIGQDQFLLQVYTRELRAALPELDVVR